MVRRTRTVATALMMGCALFFGAEAGAENSLTAGSTLESGTKPADSKIYYKEGTTLEFGDLFNMKINMMVIYRYRYQDIDGGQDVNDFSAQNVRLYLRGDLLNKQFSYYINNDFVGGKNAEGASTSEIRDAFIQWNWDPAAKLVFGQFRVPFTRSWMGGAHALEMLDYSPATLYFYRSREGGVQLTGTDGDKTGTNYGYYLGLFNGESSGEGMNKPGTDPNLMGSGQAYVDFNGYDRNYEGDPLNSPVVAWTIGGSALYGNGSQFLKGSKFCSGVGASSALCSIEGAGSVFNHWEAGIDAGVRYAGFSAQAEGYAGSFKFSDITDTTNTQTDYGLYVQAGYFFIPKEWDVAGRFSWISYDHDISPVKNEYENQFVLGRYFLGHNFKIQAGPTWSHYEDQETGSAPGGSRTNLRLQAQVVGFI